MPTPNIYIHILISSSKKGRGCTDLYEGKSTYTNIRGEMTVDVTQYTLALPQDFTKLTLYNLTSNNCKGQRGV